MSLTRWTLLVVGLVGCGCGPKKAAPAGKGGVHEQADAALRLAATPDYQAPVVDVRNERRRKAADLYAAACKDGDVSSCVWAASLSHGVYARTDADTARLQAVIEVLAQRCLANDGDACRVFDGAIGESATDYAGGPDALCEKGLASACYASSQWDPAKQGKRNQLDPAMQPIVTKACDLGSPNACGLAIILEDGKSDPSESELARLRAKLKSNAAARCGRGHARSCSVLNDEGKTAAAAADGCPRGYLEECSQPAGTADAIGLRWARACSLIGHNCRGLADFVVDMTRKRDALEHGCQLGEPAVCLELVKGYQSKRYVEPVAGRAQALVGFLCSGEAKYCDEVKP